MAVVVGGVVMAGSQGGSSQALVRCERCGHMNKIYDEGNEGPEEPPAPDGSAGIPTSPIHGRNELSPEK